MIENQPAVERIHAKMKKISIQERSVLVENMIVVNGYGIQRNSIKTRFSEGEYIWHETPHFIAFTRSATPALVLVHFFTPEELNADIKHYVMLELKPLGLLKQSSDFGIIFSGIIGSFFPDDARSAWHGYGAKTLQRFLTYLSTQRTPQKFDYYATIGVFATWYQRVCELFVGESLLDVGCESGFLPLVIAERIPFVTKSTGIDIRPDMFAVARELAEEWHLSAVHFEEADLLANNFYSLGKFDTVTAIGVIEHFSEEDMYRVLTNLLAVTAQRLIFVVPYEQDMEIIYDHKQLFTPEKLEAVGRWCVQQFGGTARMWREECNGGLLLVERHASAK